MTFWTGNKIRGQFFRALVNGLGVTWPILAGLLAFKIAAGVAIGWLEGWGSMVGIYFAMITGLTIGYGDFVPQRMLTRILAVLIGFSGVVLTGVIAALAVQALHAVLPGKR